MRQSTDRILTTHVGSLARPHDLVTLIQAREREPLRDAETFAVRAREAVTDIIRKQSAVGLDVVNDGEQSKSGFRFYIDRRLSGLENKPLSGPQEYMTSREWQAFPEFYEKVRFAQGLAPRLTCTGPVTYKGQSELRADIENLKEAVRGVPHADAFMTAASPAYVADTSRNEYYRTFEEYELALADAIRTEYQAIVDAGLILQVDDPRWVTYYTLHPELSIEDCRRWAARRVEVINHSLRGIPPEKVRFHTCYSINIGPRIHELGLKHVVDLLLQINAGGYSIEAANPRHEHEYHVWEDTKLPEGKVLIPGVISHTTNLVEHPALVAERIVRLGRLVGRENVIASADCGFSTTAKNEQEIHPTVVWPKFASLVEGARLASQVLWA